MRALAVLIYLVVMFYFLFRGYPVIFGTMLLFAIVFIGCLPMHKEHSIKVAKKKIIDAQRAKQNGQIIKPFIEINSSPWFVLAELPGISKEMAKHAVQLRRENGPYPSIDVFIQVTNVKHVYIEHIKAVAYVKNEIPPIQRPQ
ncbi:MAG: helix-hairpin-helix domain-containing protein [bacterium]|nr:helix-hairpin-helix domain-containing protein [bacterium]